MSYNCECWCLIIGLIRLEAQSRKHDNITLISFTVHRTWRRPWHTTLIALTIVDALPVYPSTQDRRRSAAVTANSISYLQRASCNKHPHSHTWSLLSKSHPDIINALIFPFDTQSAASPRAFLACIQYCGMTGFYHAVAVHWPSAPWPHIDLLFSIYCAHRMANWYHYLDRMNAKPLLKFMECPNDVLAYTIH